MNMITMPRGGGSEQRLDSRWLCRMCPLICSLSNNKPGFATWQLLLAVVFVLSSPFAGLRAEGTRQVAPSSSDLTMLLTNRTGFGNFAAFGGPTDSRLYFSIRNVGEILHIGLSGEYTPGGALYANTEESRYRFRIVRASDGAVVHGPFLVDRSNANVTNWSNAVQGAYPVTRLEGGVPVYVFTPTAPGDYYIEFQDVLVNVPDGGTRTDGTEEVLLGLWDFTVLRNNAPVSGRLWSRNWAFRTPRNPDLNSWPDCGWNREFRGSLYSYTTDRFVSKVEFMNSGFQGLSFNVAFNSRGPSNSGNLIQDRRSLASVNQTSLAAEHQIFLNEPDIILFPNGECGVVTGAASLTCNNEGEFCLPVTVTKPGQVEVILDFNKNGKYDAGSEDVVLGYSFFGKNELSTCIPWNRIKGNGQPLSFGDDANIIYVYTQGVQHWSVYDVEFIKNGYCVQAVRPLCGESITNVLYWDDTLIPQNPGTGQPKDGQGGQACRTNGARTWDFFNPNPTADPDCLFSEEELTVGYGDKNTINTWWFASVTRVSYNDVLFLTCNITGDNEICAGTTTAFTAAGSAANADFSYSWSGPNGFTSNQASTGLISTPGQYCVTITDGEGCQTTCCQTLTVYPTPVLKSLTVPVSCAGGSDGSLSASATGGKTPYTYTLIGQGKNLSNGSGNFTGLPAGSYTLSVVDGNGCQASTTVQITAPAPLTCTVQNNQLVSCSGLSNGSATVVPQGGNGGFKYLWDNGETTATATQLSPGLHTVTVTDSKGCSTSCSTTVQTVPALACSVSTKKDVSCFGGADGSATVSPDGGTGPYTYLWSNNQTSQTASGLIAGAYSVTVTDVNNCSTTCNVTIAQPVALTCAASVVANVSCFGGENGSATVTAQGGTAPYTYKWSNNQTTQSISGLSAGTYNVTVTDNNKCTTSCTVTITQPAALTCAASVVANVSCFGGSDGAATVVPQGGVSPYTFKWSNNLSNQSISGLTAGVYSVTVTDKNGCTTSCSVTVNQPAALSCTASAVSNVSCFGGENGSATVSVQGGTAPYTFKWSNNQTTQSISGLSAGAYTVTVTDKNNCTTTCSVSISQPAALTCSAAEVRLVSCFGGSDGAVTVTAQGGTAPYTYKWSNNLTTQSISGLSAGTYTVTVTDKNGCTSSCSVSLGQPAVLLCSASVVSNVSCFGGSDGAVTATGQGGTAPYTYKWSNNLTTQSISGLPAGVYSVTVTDKNNCSTACQITVNQPAALLCTASVVANVSCFGGSDGAVTVVPQGGTGPYAFKWSNNLTTQSISGLTAGTYSVTVTDKNNCTSSCSVTVGQPDKLTCTASVVAKVSCFGGENGSVTVTAQGGTAPYSFKWSNNLTTQSISGLTAGTYSVTVTDKNNCTSTCSVTLTQPAQLSCEASVVKNVNCFGGSDGAVTATAQGGTAPYTYKWSNNLTTQSISGLPAGTYTVTVTDKNGCTSTCKATITQPAMLSCNASLVKGLTCFGGSDASATVTAQGGTAPYTYKWSTNQTTQSVSNLPGGSHKVTVTDKNGCTTTCTVTVQQPGKLVCTTKVWEDVSCYGGADGTAMVSAEGGTQPYSFKWSNGQTGTTANGLKTGTYKVTVTDKNGCQSSCEVFIRQPEPFVCTVKVWEHVSCYGGSDGTAMALVEGGTAPFSYSWSNGSTGSTANGLKAGKYGVTVTDSRGCKSYCEVVIQQPEKLSCSIYCDRNVSCVGGNDGMATVTPIGGTAPYSYQWSNGETAQTAVKLIAGTHIVVITDANGCKTSCSVVITEPKVWVLCPPDLHLSCGDPELDWEIKAWLMKAQLENACGPAQIINSYHPSRFTGTCTKTQEVTFSYGQGASLMTCTAKIIITDKVKPTIQCPPNATFACNDPNLDSKIKSWLSQAKASDNCELKSLTNDYNSVSTQPCGPNGQRVVTFTATDACGQTSTCKAYLTIADNQAPVVKVCPSDLVVECGANYSQKIQQWLSESVQKIASGASDNCDPKLDILHDYSGAVPEVTCQNSGGTRVVFTVRDDCGNTASCTAFIRILDTQAPVISCAGSYTLPGCGATPPTAQDLISQGKVTAYDECGNATLKSLGTEDVSDGCKLTRIFTFQAVDQCGRSSETCKISVSWQTSSNTGGRQGVCDVTPLPGPVGFCGQYWTVPDYSDRVKINGNSCEFIQIVQTPAPGTVIQLQNGRRIQFAGSDQCGRRIICDLEIPCRILPPALKICTYNSTYWGDNNNTPQRTPTVTGILATQQGKALQIGPWTLDADCIDVILPGQPLATEGNNLNLACNDINRQAIRKEDVHNLLIQTIVLTLNTLHAPQLKTTKLGQLDCAIPIPAGLTANSTVEDLLKLANAKLPAFDAKIAEALSGLNECYVGACSTIIFGRGGGKVVAGQGAADQIATTLELQPNPASSFLRLNLNTAQPGPVEIRLLTVQGQVVEVIQNEVVSGENIIELDLNHLRAGTYLLQVRENGQVFVERFVKADF